MNFDKRICARAFLAAATLACSPAAWSLGLGDASVESYLNQPLRARIDLITRESDDLASVTASLASAADYELIGASRTDIPVPVRFTLEDIDGDAYLLATSNLPIGNPIVRLIVEVNWASGRMLREYTLFLDPPAVADVAPPPRIEQRSRPPAPVATTPGEEPAVETRPAEAVPPSQTTTAQPEAAPSTRQPTSGEYGPVASGETLWGIAKQWSRGTGLEINQVMIAIQRENPDAFMRDNINLLKRGAILRMPSMPDVQRISNAEATSAVAEQEEALRGRNELPAASTEMPLIASESAAPEPETATEPVLAPTLDTEAADVSPDEAVEETVDATDTMAEAADDTAMSEPEPQLELVPPSADSELDSTYGFEENTDGDESVEATRALRENLARSEEELINQQQQNAYLEERIRELEQQLEEQQATVDDAGLAGMEQRLREERQAAQRGGEEPWYSRYGAWLVGLFLVMAGLIGWRLSRRDTGQSDEAIQELKGEAEEVLRVLDSDSQEPEETKAETADSDTEEEPVTEADNEDAEAAEDEPAEERPEDSEEKSEEKLEDEVEPEPKPAGTPRGQEDAELLDEDSSDPEIQLDLARAYISMGDKEAARVILEEVIANGTEAQQADARKMLDLM
jgi:pilus assembly protein FimV